jgi:hypothetical protein
MRRKARSPGAIHPKLAIPGEGKANPSIIPTTIAASARPEGMKIAGLSFIF